MSAAALKAEGNSYFGSEEWERALECYSQALELVEESDVVSKSALLSNRAACFVKLDQFDKALVDGNLCIKLRPDWSKGYARCAEAYSRQQSFRLAGVAYSEAIRTSENDSVKSRYVAALEVVKQSATKHASTNFKSSAAVAFARPYHNTWFTNFKEAKTKGYQEEQGGGMMVMLMAWNAAAEGWFAVDEAMVGEINGNFYGKAGTRASLRFSECILLDHRAFAVPRNGYRNPKYPFSTKFFTLIDFEFRGLGLLKYFAGRRWTAREIIADLEGRRQKGEVWNTIRVISATLIRGGVLMAFTKALDNRHAEAIEDLQLALELIDEGNRIWPNVSFTDKGSSYRPTIRRMIKAESLHYRVEANKMATSTSAKAAFSLKSIEAAARTIIAENPQREWKNADDVDPKEKHWTRLGYYVLPSVRANVALAYCSAQRARIPLEPAKIFANKVSVADVKNAAKAARFYDVAYKLLPNDYYAKPLIGYKALEQHLLAGGKTVKEVLDFAEVLEKLRKALIPIFTELNKEYPARTFVEERVETLRAYLKSPQAQPVKGVQPIDLVLRAVPTLNLGNSPDNSDPESMISPAFWDSLPGDAAIVIKVRMTAYTTTPVK